MNADSFLTRFEELNIWRQGDQRAPHKPLLILYALGRWQEGKVEVTFKEAEQQLEGFCPTHQSM
jgi:putative restriction endonuclease